MFRLTIIRRLYSSSSPNSLVKLHPVATLRQRQYPTYAGHAHSIVKSLIWTTPPNNVLVVKKPWHSKVLHATLTFIKHLHDNYPSVNIIVTPDVAEDLNSITNENAHAKLDELTVSESEEDIQELKDYFDTIGHQLPIYTGPINEIVSRTDLIVSLGGDGTILRGVSMFSNTTVPPVLSFSLGTLGFLLPFDFTNHVEAFKQVFESRSSMLKRERIECHIVKAHPDSEELNKQREVLQDSILYQNADTRNTDEEVERLKRLSSVMDAPFDKMTVTSELESLKKLKIHAMNDIVLHRGSLPGLINLDVYINGHYLTRTTADGLIFATPTGSTAYSLSAGGSIVHPTIKCIMLTPICPRSLSFRPLILPLNSHILIKVIGKESVKVDYTKLNAKLSIDGIPQLKLIPGDEIHIISESFQRSEAGADEENEEKTVDRKHQKSIGKSGVWCVVQSKGDWVNGINSMLGFNLGFTSNKREN